MSAGAEPLQSRRAPPAASSCLSEWVAVDVSLGGVPHALVVGGNERERSPALEQPISRFTEFGSNRPCSDWLVMLNGPHDRLAQCNDTTPMGGRDGRRALQLWCSLH